MRLTIAATLWLLVSGISPAADPARPDTVGPPVSRAETHVTDSTSPGTPAASSERAARDVVTELVGRINRADAQGVAELWAGDAVYLGPRGERMAGRNEIRTGFAGLFEDRPGMRVEVEILSVKLLGDDVALIEAEPHTVPERDDLPGRMRASIVLARHGDRWLIERLDDLMIYRPSNHAKLRPLAWLVGDWLAHGPNGEVILASRCEWTAGGNFLRRTFTARPPGKPPVSGTQMIGWDPREQCIRSWLFSSGGGLLEAEWHREESHWVIEAHGVLHDGREIHARHVLVPQGDDQFTLTSANRFVDDEPQPDMGPFIIRRAPPSDGDAVPAETDLLPLPDGGKSILP